ncbi:MAG: hypothetical protein KatS3mg101_0782 [Patescibacteria group bacterium]|nr:MAG: hypothetical protein KatS3mg101_0782 [Patescibacteria group bacterium]
MVKSHVSRDPGIFELINRNLRLVLKLLKDKRVPFLLKLLPIIGGVWLIYPDLIPGPLDDVLVIYLTFYGFIELAPDEVVKELRKEVSHGKENVIEGDID